MHENSCLVSTFAVPLVLVVPLVVVVVLVVYLHIVFGACAIYFVIEN